MRKPALKLTFVSPGGRKPAVRVPTQFQTTIMEVMMSAQQTQQQSSSQTPAKDTPRQQTSLARRSQSTLAPSVLMDSIDIFNMNPLSMFRRMQDEISRVF